MVVWLGGRFVGWLHGWLLGSLLAVKWVCELDGELVGWNLLGQFFRRLVCGFVCWSTGQSVCWSVDPLIRGSFGWSVQCSIFQSVMQAFCRSGSSYMVGCLLGELVGRFVGGQLVGFWVAW